MDPRRAIKQQRSELDDSYIGLASVLIAEQLLNMNRVLRAERIAAYMSTGGEVDCAPILDSAKLRKKSIFLPVLRKTGLLFAPVEKGTPTRANRFGILEPVYENADLLAGSDLDIVIAPLVAFDNNCNRLGMGGGYYDRSFAFRKRRKKWRRPLLIGVAYDFQRIDELQAQPWDVPLDMVITEQTTYRHN